MSTGKLTPREKAALATQSMASSEPSSSKPVDLGARTSSSSIAIGLGMTGQGGKVKELEKELSEAKQALSAERETWHDAMPTRKLDPKLIHPSKWANRHQDSFTSEEFVSLKLEIESQGGNVQPIKVRPIVGLDPIQYEIVFGHRRHRACFELGLDVLAVVESITDPALFIEMDRENRQRADLRPYEQGVMYARALDEGLFPSMRKMSEALGVDQGNASKSISIARLPALVLSAFGSPLDVQQAWSTPLTQSLQRDPDLLLSRAKELALLKKKPPAAKVFGILIRGDVSNITPPPGPSEVTGKSGCKSQIAFNRKKKMFSISIEGLDESKLKAIEKMLREL